MVIVALAGLALTRLPGKPVTLPAGAPAGPYFADNGEWKYVPGYRGGNDFTFSGDARWSFAPFMPAVTPVVVVASCQRPGELSLRGLAGADRRLSCRVPVDDHYEGALLLPADARPASVEVSARPRSSGSWTVGVLEAVYPDRFSPSTLRGGLLSGVDFPSGGRMTVTLPSSVDTANAMAVTTLCVRGVRLELSVRGRPLVEVSCDDAHAVVPGLVTALVPIETIRGLGLHGGQRVAIDVRSVGRQTDQWAVFQIQ